VRWTTENSGGKLTEQMNLENIRKRKILIGVLLAAMMVFAGCQGEGGQSGEKLAEDTGQDVSGATVGESYAYEIAITEKNQYGLVQKQPPFVMENSLERANLIRRYQYLNQPENLHHVYLMSNTGQVVAYKVAQGKVSSVNSKLTNDAQIVGSKQCIEETHQDDEASCFKAVESPQIDGSYGSNGDAIFFFTTDGEYVEWNGIYLVSEEPQSIQSAVVLTDEAEDGTGDNGNATNSLEATNGTSAPPGSNNSTNESGSIEIEVEG